MKATGIVRRVDDLGRIVIPKEIRRTLRIREGDPSQTTLTPIDKFCMAIHSLAQRLTAQQKFYCAVCEKQSLLVIIYTVRKGWNYNILGFSGFNCIRKRCSI